MTRSLKFLILNLLVLYSHCLPAQIIHGGYLNDKSNSEVIIGAHLIINNGLQGAVTNTSGYFTLAVKVGDSITISAVNYRESLILVNEDFFNTTVIYLEPENKYLKEVTVKASKLNKQIGLNSYHVKEISSKDIESLPMVFGEPDIIKAIQLQTGVKTIGDGSSGIFVRGGKTDQNLILLDDVPIYNPAHLLGLVSIVNPDALNYSQLFKGVAPAKFGGRLSSVLNLTLKEGNRSKFLLNGGISLFGVRASIQGPVKKNTSFIFSLRTSYLDKFISPSPTANFVPSFYDVNAKVSETISPKQKLMVSFYHGSDNISSYDGLSNHWSNSIISAKHTYIFSDQLFSKATISFSKYDNDLSVNDSLRTFNWNTGITDYGLKWDLDYFVKDYLKLNGGIQIIYHEFIPGSENSLAVISNNQSFETASYLSADWVLEEKFDIQVGLRFSSFHNIGKGSWLDLSDQIEIDQFTENESGIYQTYSGLEPRINLLHYLNKSTTLQIGVGRNFQYYQLLQNQQFAYNSIESWFPANPNFGPQYADQLTFGLATGIDFMKVSLEGYYKYISNIIDYEDHTPIIGNALVEENLLTGKARAYGVETESNFFFNKINGTVSYTWSRAIQQIDGINNNDWYSSLQDIPHDIRVVGNYQTKGRWEFGLNWMFMSGRPVTIPTGFVAANIDHQNSFVPIYTERNGGRLPNYHRLDISAKLKPKEIGKKIKGTLILGFFNIYARQNPLGYDFMYDATTNEFKAYQMNFIRFFPNVVYNIELR